MAGYWADHWASYWVASKAVMKGERMAVMKAAYWVVLMAVLLVEWKVEQMGSAKADKMDDWRAG